MLTDNNSGAGSKALADILDNDLNQLFIHAQQQNHRQLVVISGDHQWGLQRLSEFSDYFYHGNTLSIPRGDEKDTSSLRADSHKKGLWLGEDALESIPAIPANKASQWLGRECDFLVFNAWSGFDVDAFGAISGTLRGGGLMFYWCRR